MLEKGRRQPKRLEQSCVLQVHVVGAKSRGMATIEEMMGWTPQEIEAAIRSSLPPGVQFDCGFDQAAGTWFVRFWREQKKEAGAERVVLYEDWGIEQRITYFNAYGWVWARQRPKPPAHSPWVRHQDKVNPQSVRKAAQTVQQRVPFVRAPDPADLDPKEIQSVYADLREHLKKR